MDKKTDDKIEEIVEESWYLIDPPKPIDGKFYDIELIDGTIHKNLEYWAFNALFIKEVGQDEICKDLVKKFKLVRK